MSTATMPMTPNETLYVSNIDWKIKKALLKRALYSLFTRHGKVLEIVALRKDGLRGQAFVIMDSIPAATAALQHEQGFPFFGKDLKIAYAHAPSDRIAKRKGTYVPKAKRVKRDKAEQTGEAEGGTSTTVSVPAQDVSQEQKQESEVPQAPPSKILFAPSLPQECNEMMLGMLFRQYPGFVEVRMPRPGLAFCEFASIPQATVALDGLQGFQLTPTETLKLTYGKQ